MIFIYYFSDLRAIIYYYLIQGAFIERIFCLPPFSEDSMERSMDKNIGVITVGFTTQI